MSQKIAISCSAMGKLLFLIDGFVVIIILSDFAEFSLLFSPFYFIELTLITSGERAGSSSSQKYVEGYTKLYHDEETYTQATTFQAMVGDTISCEAWVSSNGSGSVASVYLNGANVAEANSDASSGQGDENTATYDYTVVSDATIELRYSTASWYGGGYSGGRIYITDTNA